MNVDSSSNAASEDPGGANNSSFNDRPSSGSNSAQTTSIASAKTR
ncbi:hypothetical protein MSIMFI_05516 [Mycobacterium simulans]|nr:hypothetical protein MSIMFI_05516 [Mycobacterium simulans]